MTTYPVHCAFVRPARYSRLQLLIRLLASVVLGILGLSLAALYAAAYIGLSAYAAARIAARGPDAYLAEDGPSVTRGLAWFSALLAWFGLVVDTWPVRAPSEVVELGVETRGRPTPVQVILRTLLGLPAALVLAFVTCVGGVVWLVSVVFVLVSERIPDGAYRYLAGVQRMAVRLLAYVAGLVDEYPPMTFEDSPAPLARTVGGAA